MSPINGRGRVTTHLRSSSGGQLCPQQHKNNNNNSLHSTTCRLRHKNNTQLSFSQKEHRFNALVAKVCIVQFFFWRLNILLCFTSNVCSHVRNSCVSWLGSHHTHALTPVLSIIILTCLRTRKKKGGPPQLQHYSKKKVTVVY